MSITRNRRERERAERHSLILAVARELAEAEGWEAVTTRRLAERVEYSQPVLYSHFKGKDAIVAPSPRRASPSWPNCCAMHGPPPGGPSRSVACARYAGPIYASLSNTQPFTRRCS
jgi:hypothetical protein